MMDYKKMAEIVTREVDSRLEKKRKRTILVRRISFSVSGLCAALILCVGILHNDDIKNAFRNRDSLIETSENIISDIDTTSDEDNMPVTTAADNEFNAVTAFGESQISSGTVTAVQTSSFNISDNNTCSSAIITNKSSSTAASIAEMSPVTTEKPVSAIANTSAVTTKKTTTTIAYTSSVTAEKTITTTVNASMVTDETTVTKNNRPTTTVPKIPAITTSADDNHKYYFYITVVDKDTKEKIDNVHLTLERQGAVIYDSWNPDYDLIGERETVAEWNTSDTNPFISDTYIRDDKRQVIYFLTSDKLPDGYRFYSDDVIYSEFVGCFFDGCMSATIELKKTQ